VFAGTRKLASHEVGLNFHHLFETRGLNQLVDLEGGLLSRMTEQARAAIGSETIVAVADRGYYRGEEIVACEQAGRSQ
jgi:hypothetical protein